MSRESAATLYLFAWCQAEREAESFMEDWGDGAGTDSGASVLVEASKRAFHLWDARPTLAVVFERCHTGRVTNELFRWVRAAM